MGKQGKQPTFNGNVWREKKIALRTQSALKEKENAFVQEHSTDTIEQHLEYLRQCAKKLKHTPQINEVLGGQMIAQQCGGWKKAVTAAGLPLPQHRTTDIQTKLYLDEWNYQEKHFKEISVQEQQQRRSAREAQATEEKANAKAERLARHERDMRWGEEHKTMSYDDLAAYLRKCATEMGRTPYTSEVVGGGYICMRFGTWALALHYANLPMPSGTKAPTPAERKELQAKINGCQPGIAPETYTTE